MPEKPMKVGEIALKLAVDTNTIRNWCRRYASHLSPTANPPRGGERLLTTRDTNVFTYIQACMNDGMKHHEIAERLGERDFNAHEVEIVIPESQPPPPTTAQDAPHDALLLPVALSGINDRITALERRLEADIARVEQQQRHATDRLITGLVLGGACMLIAVAVVLGWLA